MSINDKLIGLKRHVKAYNKPKVFGIGANKTGTTSLKAAMLEMGFIVGSQTKAEKYLDQWARRDFSKIIKYCYSAEFFQDVPFSYPFTYIPLDQAFPGSKFILTVRDNSEQWYNSITKFHAKKWGENGRVPTKEDLENAIYREKSRPWKSNRLVFNSPEEAPYHKKSLTSYYEQHNTNILEYFRHRPNDLLVLNVAEKNAHKKLCDFLGVETKQNDFPWKNKTSEIK